MGYIKLTTPLKKEDIKDLRAGDKVLISGIIYTGRDAAHKKFIETLEKGEKLPFDINGAVIYQLSMELIKVGIFKADDTIICTCAILNVFKDL